MLFVIRCLLLGTCRYEKGQQKVEVEGGRNLKSHLQNVLNVCVSEISLNPFDTVGIL